MRLFKWLTLALLIVGGGITLSGLVPVNPSLAQYEEFTGFSCDGTTDNSPTLSAFLTAHPHGVRVRVPGGPGHACVLKTGVTFPSGTAFEGVAFHNWPGLSGSAEQWAANGSWIKCADTTNPCITINGVGTIVRNINFIYDQNAVPDLTANPSATWNPIIYPYTIAINGSADFTALENISITAATHCIDFEGPTSGVSGIATWMHNIYFNGCFNVGTRFHRIDNTIHASNLRYDNWWNANNAAVVKYIEANKVDWDIAYLANMQADGIEFFQSYRAMQFTNDSVTSGFGTVTFAANDLQLTNISFNEVCGAMVHATANDRSAGTLSNVILYQDTSTDCVTSTPNAINLNGAYGNWMISNLMGGYVQTLAAIDSTSSLVFNGVDVQKYSAFGTGAPAFALSNGGSLWFGGSVPRAIRPGTGAGPMVGPGLDGTVGYLATIAQGGAGGNGATSNEGYSRLEGAQGNGNAGSVTFWAPNGTRLGYVGRNSVSGGEINIVSDAGGSVSVGHTGSNTRLSISHGLPTSCSGLTTGDLWADPSASGTVKQCP
jgi:hypothetical protein